jgi:mRNA-degrading endonuclease RelE of RelBE toxin-antitoxin system
MPFKITITEDADRQFASLPEREQRILKAVIQFRLEHEPTKPTKAIKRLRPNPLAGFELRSVDLRALYNVEGDEIVILIVGRKVGNKLIVEGEDFMAIKTIPLSRLETDLKKTLNECAESGETVVVEMPDQRLLAIQLLGPQEDDSLTDELLASNPNFQALVAKSKASPRKPFVAGERGLTDR